VLQSQTNSSPTGRPRLIAFAVAVWIAAAWLYTWSPAAFPAHWLVPHATSLYHELTDGFLAGHLHVTRTPDPRLVALPDPYDPAANAPYRVNDLSYHDGRYYFYPSAVPVLLLFAPVKILTGSHLTETGACAVFTIAGLATALAFLLVLHRRFFPAAPSSLVAGAMVALALCQGYHVAIRSESYNLVPITCAHFWLMLALLTLLQALRDTGGVRWLAAASLAYALAIASRPNYLLGAATLLVPVVIWWRADGWRPSRALLGRLLAVGLPMLTVATILLAYNLARFGRLAEFGMSLQLGAWDQRTMGGLSLANVPDNAWHYLLGPGDYHATFPYVTAPFWTAPGVIWHAPVVLLALLLPALWPKLSTAARAALLLPLIVAILNLGFLLLFPSGDPVAVRTSANARYLFDFLPAWVLLAAGTTVAAAARPLQRRLLSATAGGLLAVSILAALSLDFSRLPPESYRPLARLLNQPAWFWEQARGITYGPLELVVELPADRTGAYEPLLAAGTPQAGDLLTIFYETPQTIRVGLVGTGAIGPRSDSIAVDYAVPHRFEFHLGPLYPDIGHPLLAAFDPPQVARLKRHLLVRLDGRTVLDTPVFFHNTRSDLLRIGETAFLLDYTASRFTGKILSQRRLPLPPPVPSETAAYGPLRLELRFPINPDGRTEPLVSTGVPQAGDLLAVTYRGREAVRFTFDHWGHGATTTDWLPVDFDRPHTLEISFGGLMPAKGHALLAGIPAHEKRLLRDRLLVRLNGEIVLDGLKPAYASSPYDVFVGRNLIGSTLAGPIFTGEILRAERLPLSPP